MITPINFITAPAFAYPRLIDPVDKAATTLLVTQYDNFFTFECENIREDLNYVRDYLKRNSH